MKRITPREWAAIRAALALYLAGDTDDSAEQVAAAESALEKVQDRAPAVDPFDHD